MLARVFSTSHLSVSRHGMDAAAAATAPAPPSPIVLASRLEDENRTRLQNSLERLQTGMAAEAGGDRSGSALQDGGADEAGVSGGGGA